MNSLHLSRSQAGRLHGAALVGLAEHVAEHQLVFLSIAATAGTCKPLQVFLGRNDWPAWLETVEIDATNDEKVDGAGIDTRFHTTWHVRFGSGLHVELEAYRTLGEIDAYWAALDDAREVPA